MDLEEFKELHTYFSQKDLPEAARETAAYEAYTDAVYEDETCYNWATAEKLKHKGFDYESYCCLMMADNVFSSLDEKGEIRFGDTEVIINKWDEGIYGIPIHGGGTAMVLINYCPWCGEKLAK